jgi:hypothetical protein
MKVAIAYLTKDRIELTKQTASRVCGSQGAVFWVDGSTSEEGRNALTPADYTMRFEDVRGGADAAIVFALTAMLEHSAGYTHVGLCENDVLLAADWFERTIDLFQRGADDGLEVGAVSSRAYEDRVLVQRDTYALMHNLGAGHVIFTRKAAELVLDNYRTGWWSDNRAVFAQLSGIDIGRYAAFRGNQQWTTADWGFDAVLAQHGLASLALTSCAAEMIGQEPSLEEQGLRLVQKDDYSERVDDAAFGRFVARTAMIRNGEWRPDTIAPVHRYGSINTYFAHLMPHAIYTGDWRLRWSQGFGPFAYLATGKECKLRADVFGSVTFLVSGGKRGAKVKIVDTESGYEIEPDLPAGEMNIAQLNVPSGMAYREIVLTCGEGAMFYGIQTTEPQPVTNRKFDYHSLPKV